MKILVLAKSYSSLALEALEYVEKNLGLAGVSEVLHLRSAKVKVGSMEIIIMNVKGNYYATSHLCTHEDYDLAEGSIQNRLQKQNYS